MPRSKTLRTCPNGHQYDKSTDCPTCPICQQQNKPIEGFLAKLSSPARSALEFHRITTLEILSNYTENDILKLHGIGPASLPTLRQALKEQGLAFKSS